MKASAPALRNAQLCAGIIAVVALVYWPTTSAIWSYWTDPDGMGTHGVLVALISAWLLFRSRHRLNSLEVRPSRWTLLPLVLASLAWLVFWRARVPALQIMLFPALMGLGIAAALGWKAARWAAFPIGFLYFAVPSWDVLIEPLQSLTVVAMSVAAPLIGIPSHVQGHLVLLPGVGTFEIGRGCSGVNFLSIGLAVAALLGELEDATVLRRFTLLGIMGAAAIVSNWIRVLVIIDAGYTTNMRHVLVSSHYTFGWVLFSIVMFGFTWLFARAPQASGLGDAPARLAASAPLASCVTSLSSLVALPLVAYGLVGTADAGVTSFAFRAPGAAAGWQGPEMAEQRFIYQAPTGERVELTALGSGTRDPGKELANVLTSVAGTNGPPLEGSRTVIVDGLSYTETATTDSQGRRVLLWFTYDIGGHRVATPLLSRLWYGVTGAQAVLFAFWTGCGVSCDTARHTLTDFARTLGPRLSYSTGPGRPSPSHQGAL